MNIIKKYSHNFKIFGHYVPPLINLKNCLKSSILPPFELKLTPMDSKFDADSDGTFRISRKTIFGMSNENREPQKLDLYRDRG